MLNSLLTISPQPTTEKFQKAKKKLSKTKRSGNKHDGSDLEEMEDGNSDSKEVDYMSHSSGWSCRVSLIYRVCLKML